MLGHPEQIHAWTIGWYREAEESRLAKAARTEPEKNHHEDQSGVDAESVVPTTVTAAATYSEST
ncbi:MAG: hypothetical protein GEV28_26560 [Actinophytocola sp.]|uniref:hypothetical protein n=1 Tax=Actinophytocola sp. TaxID=1872138 RepID=UPI0013214A82|nr:hypothetical protein [Actinophytocola sp.]MPZ83762.1 hypothetical protein [Actinophytocola sp.]